MSDTIKTEVKSKKDQKSVKTEQWAETKDAFVNMIYKKLRSKNKKLDRIKETENNSKNTGVQLRQEQLDKIQSKNTLIAEMQEFQDTLKMYQQAFPENPAFEQKNKKKEKKPKGEMIQHQVQQVQAVTAQQEPEVDVKAVIENALALLADSIALTTLSTRYGEELPGADSHIKEAISILHKTFEGVAGYGHENFSWESTRNEFIENFARLANKSQMQVGTTGKSFAEIQNFISGFKDANEGLLKKQFTRKEPKTNYYQKNENKQQNIQKQHSSPQKDQEVHHHLHQEGQVHHHTSEHDKKHTHPEEEKKQITQEGQVPTEEGQGYYNNQRKNINRDNFGTNKGGYQQQEEGEGGENRGRLGYRGNNRGNNRGRGGRGGYGQRENLNVDDEGFTVIKDKEEPKFHHRGNRRGGNYRGDRGGYEGGSRGSRGGRGDRGSGEEGQRTYTDQRQHQGKGDVRNTEQPAATSESKIE